MPVLFVHGVNVRDTDPAYLGSVLRVRKLLELTLVEELRPRFPKFAILDEAYWGDLGVRFRLPTAELLGAQPSESTTAVNVPHGPNSALERFALRASAEATDHGDPAGLAAAGITSADTMLVLAARRHPAEFVNALVAAETDRLSLTANETAGDSLSQRSSTPEDGLKSALLLRASYAVTERDDLSARIGKAETADELVAEVAGILEEEYRQIIGTSDLARGRQFGMGPLADAQQWGVEVIKRAAASSRAAINNAWNRVQQLAAAGLLHAGAKVLEVGSPAAASKIKSSLGDDAMLLLGDAFEYFRRGKGVVDSDGSISRRVGDRIAQAAGIANNNAEPLVLITHSFGSSVVYDLLTGAERFKDVSIAMWAMAGSQVPFFAAMHAYSSQQQRPGVSNTRHLPLPKPASVKVWLNFHSATDLLSFEAQPVFGTDVIDIPPPDARSLIDAHGAYFDANYFYETLIPYAAEMKATAYG